MLNYLYNVDFYGIYKCGSFLPNYYLITALIEGWHPKTCTVHLQVEKAIIILLDVMAIWGLPMNGHLVTDIDYDQFTEEWITYCQEQLL